MRRGIPKAGDVVLTVEAPLGEVAQLGSEKIALAQRVVTLRGKIGVLDSTYLLFMLQCEEMQEQLKSRATGTTVIGIKQSELRKVSVKLPPYKYQLEVAEMLKSIDDCIAALRETNTTLESMAQAIFKSWFVDFDPVHAKTEGRVPDGMDAATAALFPDSFEESELGLIPKGWNIKTIGDAIKVVGGATPDTKNLSYWEPAVHCWTTPKVLSGIPSPVILDTERKLSNIGISNIGSGLLPSGSLLLSSRAPIGYLAITQVPMGINQGYIAMPPSGLLSPLYMLFWCRQNMDIIKCRANGSTFMEISKKAFKPILSVIQNTDVLSVFDKTVGSLFELLVDGEKEAQALSTLRDTLLPRLISGQLRIPELPNELQN